VRRGVACRWWSPPCPFARSRMRYDPLEAAGLHSMLVGLRLRCGRAAGVEGGRIGLFL
jgi:hypothetical protein